MSTWGHAKVVLIILNWVQTPCLKVDQHGACNSTASLLQSWC